MHITKTIYIAALALVIATPVFAADVDPGSNPQPPAPATVTLTQKELQELVTAEITTALSRQANASVYSKVQEAFAPKAPPVTAPAVPTAPTAPGMRQHPEMGK